MRRDAAQRPPTFGDLVQRFGVGPLFEAERKARRLLQGEVAGGEGVRMTKAEEEKNIGRLGPDSFDRDERAMRLLRREGRQAGEVERTGFDGRSKRPQGAHFGQGQAAGAQSVVFSGEKAGRTQRRKIRLDPLENGVGARRRDLLRDDDPTEAGKARFAAAQRRRPRRCDQLADEIGIERQQLGDGRGERRFAVDQRSWVIDVRGERTGPAARLTLRRRVGGPCEPFVRRAFQSVGGFSLALVGLAVLPNNGRHAPFNDQLLNGQR